MTGKKLQAIALVAADKLSNAQIAAKVGVSPRTLDNWKADPEFKAEVERLLNAWHQQVFEKGIADRRRRVYRQNDRWRRLQAVIEQRAKRGRELIQQWEREVAAGEAKGESPDRIQPFPGIETGLIVLKPTRYGTVAEVDTGLLAEMRALEQHTAVELGQWKEKWQPVGEDGDGPAEIRVVFVRPGEKKDAEPAEPAK